MIGDLLSNLAQAQKLDIASIQKAVQDGTLPAYVGIPLIQQKMQQRKEAEGILSGQKQQNEPPIGQQVMQAADRVTGMQPQGIQALQQPPQPASQQMAQAQPQQGIDSAQSNLPVAYAGGGIVAFVNNKDQPVSADMPTTDDLNKPAFYPSKKPAPVDPNAPSLGTRFMNWLVPPYETKPVIENEADRGTVTPEQREFNKTIPGSGDQLQVVRNTAPVVKKPTAAAPTPTTTETQPTGIDTLAEAKASKSATMDELKQLILGNKEDAEKNLKTNALMSLVMGGFRAAAGTSPYALTNIAAGGEQAAQGIQQALAAQQAEKQKQVQQLVALGLKGTELDQELAKLGITKDYYQAHAPLFKAQAAEAYAKIPYYGAMAAAAGMRGSNAGLPKGITSKVADDVLDRYAGFANNPTTAPFYKQDMVIPTPKGNITWNDTDRKFLEKASDKPGGKDALAKWNAIVEINKNKRLSDLYNLGGRNTASSVYGNLE